MRRSVLLLAAVLFAAAPLPALDTAGPHARPELLIESASLVPGQTTWAGIRFKMDPGWHIYWKNPGDSGMPPRIDWILPEGITAGPINWPAPKKIIDPPLVSYGYSDEATLLVPLTVGAQVRAGTDVSIGARLSWLECEKICIPGKGEVSIRRPVTAGPSGPHAGSAPLFAAARNAIPLSESGWSFEARPGAGFIRLMATPPAGAAPVTNAWFYPEEKGLFLNDAAQEWKRNGQSYSIDIARSDISSGPVAAVVGVLVSEDGWRGPGSERAVAVNAPVSGAASASEGGVAMAILLAFLGGLLLNLMPCVLPVLSIKVLSLAESAHERAGRMGQGLAYTAGVLVTFWALAGLLIALRAGGQRLGWGFQLQSPALVAGLAAFFFLFALNLFGVFEIGASLTRLGGGRRNGLAGSFGSGLLATVVATPCTAPFMGSALGFALTQPAAVALAVFTSLGVGMALPFAALAAFPPLLRWVPRPGAWMESMKQALGFLMAATVVWLLWVLGRQAGPDAMIALCAGLLALSFGAWIFGRWSAPHRSPAVRWFSILAALLIIGAGFAVSIGGARKPVAGAESIAWEPWSAARVAQLRSEGRAVFVDFTAAWCLTCQVNERVALGTPEVAAKFKERDVATLKADWTSQDPAITEALTKLGRSGVPVYVLYPRDATQPPRLLPEVLTPALVLGALDSI